MDTINNVANAAAKAVWGEGEDRKEPVSGATGDTSKGEPYDAGNLDSPDQKKVASAGDSAKDSNDPGPQPDSKPAPADTTGGQNDTRNPNDVDPDEPSDDVSGPGPRPLEDVAREHGGDAGKDKEPADESGKDKDSSEGTDLSESTSKGTGEQYVKTSGLAADGGDFDATKPGAGREADRLLEQKGVQRSDDPKAKQGDNADGSNKSAPSSPDSSKKDKPGFGERIKAKLHKH